MLLGISYYRWTNIVLYIFWLTALFWIAETAFFIIIEGWHETATNPIEKICDSVVSILFNILSLILLGVTISWVFERIEEEHKEKKRKELEQ